MMRWITRYHPRFVRSLVYMMQAAEYRPREYLAWYARVQDFRHVEYRKRLKFSGKAIALLAIALVIVLPVLFVAVWGISLHDDVPHVVGLGLLILLPLLLPYLLLIPLVFLNLAQKPIEAFILSKARKILIKHKALRIAIAGSYGKTSMREILKTLLSEGKKVAAPPESRNTPLGIARFVQTLKGDEDILIFELGEYYSGDIKKLSEFVEPSIGIITGVNEAHLEKFKTTDSTAHTIFELADFIKQPNHSNILKNIRMMYVNAEDAIAQDHALPEDILYDRTQAGGIVAERETTSLDGTSFTLRIGAESMNVHTKLLGLHHVGPLLAAAHIAKRLGLTNEQIVAGIQKTRPFEYRLNPRIDGGVTVLDDSYNGNPAGVKAVIDFLASIRGHRRWYVTPGLVEMGSRKEEIHEAIGTQLAAKGIEKVLLIRNSVTQYIEEGLKREGFKGDIIWYEDALKAYSALPHMTLPGDVVVLQNDWPDQYA